MTYEPQWTVLIATGDPRLTYTEPVYTQRGLDEMIEYYGEDRLLIIPTTEATHQTAP